MPATLVARLEGKRTHDGFDRRYHPRKGGWEDHCTICGVKAKSGDGTLLCTFCPRGFHMRCIPGMEHRQRAPRGDWSCPVCQRAIDADRPVDPPPRASRRAKPTSANVMVIVSSDGEEAAGLEATGVRRHGDIVSRTKTSICRLLSSFGLLARYMFTSCIAWL